MAAITKHCLIVGIGSDIGSAIAKEIISSYQITGTYFHTKREELKNVHYLQCDLRDLESIDQLIQTIRSVDLIVTAALPFLESNSFDFQTYLQIEALQRGHIYLFTKLRPLMNKKMKIINMLGQCVERGLPGAAFYSATFAFLHNWGHSVNAKEGKAQDVSVCNLLLGPVDTREWKDLSKDVRERYEAKISQFIHPKQVAEIVGFLAKQTVLPSTFKLDAYYGY